MKKTLSLFFAISLMLHLLCGCGASDGGSSRVQKGDQAYQNAAALVRDIPTVQYFADEAVAEADLQLILEAGVQAPSAMNGQPWHFTAVTDASVLQQIANGMGGGMSFSGMGAPPEGMEMPGLPDGAAPSGTPEGAPEGAPSFPGGADIPAGADMPSGGGDMPPTAPGGASSAPNKAGIADAPLAIIVSAKQGSEFDAGLACQNMSVEAQLLGYGTKIISSTTMVLNGEKQAEYRELLGIPEDMSAVAVLLVGIEDEAAAAANGVDGAASATARNPLDTVVTYVKAN